MKRNQAIETATQQDPQAYYSAQYVPLMLSIQKAAECSGLSYEYIRALCHQKKIVHVKSGNKFLVNFPKLIEYLNTGIEQTA